MLGALLLALSAWKRLGGSNSATLRSVDGRAARPTREKAKPQGSTRERLEERWKQRWEERGGLE